MRDEGPERRQMGSMHRLTDATWIARALAASAIVLVAGCGGGSPPPESPSAPGEGDAPTEQAGDDEGAAPKPCEGFDIGDLEDLLAKSDCEVPDATPEGVALEDLEGKLEITAGASPTKVAPGGKVDLVVTFTNKTADSMPLSFRIDPLARFETETYDAKGKRADVPTAKQPSLPKDYSPPPPSEPKVARVTVAANGSARVVVPWEAVRMRWAPDKVRGTAVERGYPRVPAGPLPRGTYTVKIMTPLVGVSEGVEHEVSAPKVEIEVGR